MLASTAAGADQRDLPPGVANSARRQALLHRSWPSDGVPGRMLVTVTTAQGARRLASDEGGSVVGERTVVLAVDPGTEARVAGRLAAEPGVLGIEPDRLRTTQAVPDDPDFSQQWSHTVSDIQPAWDRTTGSSAVKVAVLDTGIDGRHPDLFGNVVKQVDVSAGRVIDHGVGVDNDACDVGHGTFVAGVIGAVGGNGKGVAGVAWHVSIVDVALASPASRCGILDSAIIAGVDYAVRTAHADILNLSLGGVAGACPTAMQSAFDDARDAGTIVVAAAGNDQESTPGVSSVPGSCNGVVSVGAVGQTGAIAPYSDVNEWIDLAAPGGDTTNGTGIVSTMVGGRYGEEEGTSFASPYVAGAMALLLSIDPTLTPDELESIVEHTASDRGDPGRDDTFGWGIVDVGAAAAMAASGSIPPLDDDPRFPLKTSGLDVQRIAPSSDSTDPIAQAVAMSREAFDTDQAFHAVLARSDDFADALAGSALGFGLGPLLFTTSTGPLASATASELTRVLEPGKPVYLLGGRAALPPTLEGQIRDLGFEPVRVAGTTRQLTAVEVGKQLETVLRDNEFSDPHVAIVATAYNWPDAVSAGALGAWFGIPILLTSAGSLDSGVSQFLSDRMWNRVYVIGGTAAISEATRGAIRDAAHLSSGDTVRLAGVDRSGTTVAVSREFERAFSAQFQAAFGQAAIPGIVAAVNLRAPGGFAHVLSASALLGEFSGVFLPVEGVAGDHITDEAQAYACRFPAAGVVVGGTPLVTDGMENLVDALLKGDAPACQG